MADRHRERFVDRYHWLPDGNTNITSPTQLES
jgi:hypothetical protein